MRNVLVVYAYRQYPPRSTIYDHIYSLGRYSGHRVFYLNLAVDRVPWWVRQVPFDLVVFHTVFLSQRWDMRGFRRLLKRAQPLKALDGVKIALPQDEFIQTDAVVDFVNEFGVDRVFSVAPESEWPKIYDGVDTARTRFHRVLTGYLDEGTVERISRLPQPSGRRPIDVGYRAWRAAPWLGRHGLLKTRIADVFAAEGPRHDLRVDVSTRNEDTILGDDWFRFLLRCEYTIGVEGGASILDRDGSIMERTNAFVTRHPTATFEQIEAACFPGLDGGLDLMAISPRHLEACATRTAQVLVEGEYNGILQPGRHYIPLRRDFSNLGAVFDALRSPTLRTCIAQRAFEDVVSSQRYTYRSFTDQIIKVSLEGVRPRRRTRGEAIFTRRAHQLAQAADSLAWRKVALGTRVDPARARLTRLANATLPPRLVEAIREAR